MSATLKWIKRGNGHYASECGRFSIARGIRRGEYTLYDRDTRDACCPQYNRTATVSSIEHGKNVAARWMRGVN